MDSLRLLENPAESKVKISDLLISIEKFRKNIDHKLGRLDASSVIHQFSICVCFNLNLNSLFVTSSSIVSLTTFAFVIGHSANSTIFTVKSTSLILAIGTTETMRTRAHVVTDANSTIGTMRRARI